MFGGNVRPSKGRTQDSAHGGARSGSSVKDATRGPGNGEPEPEAEGITEGDGYHHHQIDENESGYHSIHTHPDGKVEHADHATYDEAKEHMDRSMTHDDMGADDGGSESHEKDENNDDQPDFSGAYCK